MTALASARFATSVLFVLNGVFYATFLPRIPAISDRLELSPAVLGVALAGMPGGALVAGLLAGPAIARFGGARVAVACAVAHGGLLWLPGVTPSAVKLLLALAIFGAFDAVMDVAMNANGIVVQRQYGRTILNSFHGWWSVGGVLGAAIGAAAAALGVPVAWHLGTVGVVSAAAALAIFGLLTSDRPANPTVARGPAHRRHPGHVLIALGPIVPFAMLIVTLEEVPGNWGALYLRDVVGAPIGLAGAGFVVFSVAMTIGRFTGDRFVRRFGTVPVARTGAAAAAVAFGALVLLPHPAVAMAALAIAGLGTATLFPAMLAAAAHRPGVHPDHALSVVSWVARVGFLASPLLVGAIADLSSLAWGVATAAVFALGAAALARFLASADQAGMGTSSTAATA